MFKRRVIMARVILIVTIMTKLYFFSDSKGTRHFLPPTFWYQFGRWCDNWNVFQSEIHGTNSPRGLHSLEPSTIGWILLHLLRYEQVSQIWTWSKTFWSRPKYFGLGLNRGYEIMRHTVKEFIFYYVCIHWISAELRIAASFCKMSHGSCTNLRWLAVVILRHS